MKNETREVWKSALIGAIALIALICWLEFQPRFPDVKPKEKIGKKLLEAFDDPNQMSRVEFTRINPDSGELQQLVLVRDEDVWRLPGMTNFPAENAEQVAKVVAPLIQLLILDVVDETINSSDPAKMDQFHRECGLLNPINFDPGFELKSTLRDKASSEEAGETNLAQGSALAVKIEGVNGETLVDLLIGSRVPESSATRDNRFVRFPNEDVVYTVDFLGDSTHEQGTTEFIEFPQRVSFDPLDWIDSDLLRISRWDVLYLTVRDYSFSLTKTKDSVFQQEQVQQEGVAVFKQSVENSLSRMWTLKRLLRFSPERSWKETENPDPETAQNETLNNLVEALGALKIVDVRKKPDSVSNCFRRNRLDAELTAQSGLLGDFGFSFFDHDPLSPDSINPILVGEGGSVEMKTKGGVDVVLIFGKKFDNQRACLAYASFDRETLAEATDDETEVVFLAPESEKKANLKNQRLADWFYLISEEDYQNIHFRLSETIK
ncbi:MAG: DUF4340 domain-containing protein [Thermoguttaceae bacterium]|nr:DUF4340 domain-containing protein [Thermoguttaceae bacterium]